MTARVDTSGFRIGRLTAARAIDLALALLIVLQLLDLHSSLHRHADELNHFIRVVSQFSADWAALLIAKFIGVCAVACLFFVHRRFPSLRFEVGVYVTVALVAYAIVVINNYGGL